MLRHLVVKSTATKHKQEWFEVLMPGRSTRAELPAEAHAVASRKYHSEGGDTVAHLQI